MAYRVLAIMSLLLLLPAAADPPADAFCVILFEAAPDFSTVTVTVDEETTMDEREELWPEVDRNGDGSITPTEKEAWKWDQTRTWDMEALGHKAITLHQDAPYTTWPEQQPVYGVTWRQVGHVFHQRDHELPDTLSQSADLETQEVRTFGFETSGGEPTRVVLRGGRDLPANLTTSPDPEHEGRPVIEYVVVRAPSGWIVERVEGRSYNGTIVEEPGTRVVDLPAFDTKAPYAITFFHPARHKEQSDLGGIPGLTAVLGIIALAGACFLRRR